MTFRQITQMTQNKNPYIRGLAILYLRFVYDPTKLLEWFSDFMYDEEMILFYPKSRPMYVFSSFLFLHSLMEWLQ
jgi:hypothetical protein